MFGRGFSAQLRIRTRAVPKLVFVAALNAWLLSHSWLELQTKFLSRGSACGPAPEIDGQAPGSCHNESAFTSFAGHTAQFLSRWIVRLPACHSPDGLDKGVTHHRVTTLVNVAFSARVRLSHPLFSRPPALRRAGCGRAPQPEKA